MLHAYDSEMLTPLCFALPSGRGSTSVIRRRRSYRGDITETCSPDREMVREQQRTGPVYSGGDGTASQEAEGGGDPVPALDYDEYMDDELFLDDDTIPYNSDGSTTDDMESSLIFELEM